MYKFTSIGNQKCLVNSEIKTIEERADGICVVTFVCDIHTLIKGTLEEVEVILGIKIPSSWISVKDRLPPDITAIYTVYKDGEVITSKWMGTYWTVLCVGGIETGITHWIPEPGAPK